MRRSAAILFTLIVVGLGIVTGVLASRYRQERMLHAQSREAEEAIRQQFNHALEAIAEIQDSLSVIAPEGSEVRELTRHSETTPGGARTQKERMLGQIAGLRQSIQQTDERIHALEQNLKGSRTEVAGLRRVIENLKRTVAEKEALIASLEARVDSLNVAVAGLRTEVRTGQETIARQETEIEGQRRDIATVRYVIGTKDDLVKRGIIVQQGGFIGIGKSQRLSGNFDESLFTTIDTDEVGTIAIPGREPRVISDQAKSSYSIEPSGEDASVLRITDPAEFRRVKYLVVMVE